MPVPTFLRGKDGYVRLNEIKRHVRQHWLTPQGTGNRRGNVIVGANADAYLRFVCDQNGPFEGYGLSYDRTSPLVNVVINCVRANNRALMNRPVLADTIMSPLIGGQNLFLLPETLWFDPMEVYTMVFTDFSGAPNTVRPIIHGRKFNLRQAPPSLAEALVKRKSLRQQISTPYFYTTDAAVALAANVRGQQATITVSEEGHFEWWATTFWATGAFDWRVTDAASGVSFSGSEYVNSTGTIGVSLFPYEMSEPVFIAKNTALTLEFDDYSGGVNNVFLTLIGRRIYEDRLA